MAKTKQTKRAGTRHAKSRSIRVDSAVLLAVLDELNDLAQLLRCVPELNVLSSCLRARQTGQATTGHDRIAAVAREHFGRDLDVIDQTQREKDAVAYDARFGIDPPLYAGNLIVVPEAVTDAVRWRLQRLRAVLEMVH